MTEILIYLTLTVLVILQIINTRQNKKIVELREKTHDLLIERSDIQSDQIMVLASEIWPEKACEFKDKMINPYRGI